MVEKAKFVKVPTNVIQVPLCAWKESTPTILRFVSRCARFELYSPRLSFTESEEDTLLPLICLKG